MNQRRKYGWCQHRITITTITAGLAREVCEACGHVRIHYVENAVQIYPSPPRPVKKTYRFENETTTVERPRACDLCSQVAIYKIPDGMVCDEHAWQAAARTNWQDTDLWVPIFIDKSNA